MEIVKVAALAFAAGIFALAVRQKQPEIASQITIACGVIILIYVVDNLAAAVGFINDAIDRLGIPLYSITVVLKILGVAYICEFCAQTLKDVGEGSLAAKVELAGRVVIVVLILPMFGSFIEMVLGLAGGPS